MRNKMKKIAIFLIYLIFIGQVVNYQINVQAEENIDTFQLSDEQSIKNTIEKYFTNELNSIKTQEHIESTDIIDNIELESYSNLLNNFYTDWYKKLNKKLIDYELYLDYINISINSNSATVNLTKGTDMIFDCDKDITQEARGDQYTLDLIKKNNKWVIKNIIFPQTDTDTNSLEITSTDSIVDNNEIKDKLTTLQKQYDNIDSLASSIASYTSKEIDSNVSNMSLEQDTLATIMTTYTYNRTNVYNYAYKWYNSYNPVFPKFENDCTNFVSQCVNAGGYPENSSWYGHYPSYSRSWSLVVDFYNYLVGPGPGYTSTSSNMQTGDVLQLYNSSKGTWSHAMIVSSIGRGDGEIYYAAHSSPRWNYGLYNVYPSATYTNARFLKVMNSYSY